MKVKAGKDVLSLIALAATSEGIRTALDAATAVLLACDIALLVLRYRSLARPMAPLAPRYPAFFRRRGLILASRLARAEALERARGSASFRSLALAFKRVRNITEGQPEAAVDAALFAHAEERELAEATEAFGTRLAALLAERRVAED